MSIGNYFSFTFLEKKFPISIGYTYALIAHLLVVVLSDNVKRTSKSLNTFQIVTGIAIQIAVINYASLRYKDLPTCYTNHKINRLLFLRAGIGSIGFCVSTLSFVLLPLSEAVAIQMASPAITSTLAILFLKEKFDRTVLIIIITSFAGVLLVAKPPFLFEEFAESYMYPYRSIGILAGMCSTFIGSVIQILLKKLGPLANPYTITMHLGIFLTAVSATGQVVFGINNWRVIDVLLMLITGILSSVSFLFMNKSYNFGEAGKIAIMFYSQILFAYVIDVAIHGNHPDLFSVIGSICIFCSVFVMIYRLR